MTCGRFRAGNSFSTPGRKLESMDMDALNPADIHA